MIDFTRAAYICAAHHPQQWPPDEGAEVAFAGRSNVGKSSAINAIANHKRLAHASKTPGRTRQIVFFALGDAHRLVDLPGYGYAKAPKDLQRHWQNFIEQYLSQRACLKALVVPMDIRRPLTDSDRAMLDCCRGLGLPMHILLTKADKLKRGPASSALLRVRAQAEDATVQLFSATRRDGVEEAGAIIAQHLLR